MERFTTRYEDKENGKAIVVRTGRDVDTFLEGEPGYEAADKFAEYEDFEEANLLAKLPCKVGDTIWDIELGRPKGYEIVALSFGYCNDYVEPHVRNEIIYYFSTGFITGSFPASEIGKSIFLTRKAAKEKLKELKQHD